MKLTNRTLVLLALLAALSGCGKDRTIEQADAQKNIDDQAETDRVAGVYTGTLFAKSGGKPMGSLTIELSADTRVEGGAQSSVVSAQATLETSDRSGRSSETIHFADGRYDLVNHSFRINTTVGFTRSQSATLSIAGTVNDGVLKGKIEVPNYADFGGTYRLVKDAPAADVAAGPGALDRARGTRATNYRGRATTDQDATLEARFIYTPSTRNADQRFFDRFFPLRSGNVSVSLGDADSPVVVAFPDAIWDTRRGTLTGTSDGNLPGQTPYSITLNCQETGDARTPGWNCDWNGTRRMRMKVTGSAR
ncbi:MAG: hypothetical protein JST04_03315 [Bdellovibrionales bacterium]|nr:hypothetical protein [Bdellovibrionales bacterium]